MKVIRWNPHTRLRVGSTLKLAYDTSRRVVRHVAGAAYELGIPKGTRGTEVGQLLTVAPRAGHTMLLANCSMCSVLSMTVHGASDMALVEYGGGGANVWRGVRVVRNESSRDLLASNADIFESSGVERGPLVEQNEFAFNGDSCINLHNYFSVVLKAGGAAADPRRVLVLDAVGAPDLAWTMRLNTFARVRPGDVVRVYDSTQTNLSLRLTTAVVGITESTAHDDLLLANRTLAALGLHTNTRAWVGVVRCYWITLRDALPGALATSRAFLNVDRLSGNGAVVRDNIFHCCGKP